MAEKAMSSHQLPPPDKLPELAQLVMENERLRRKHRKVQHRRDHYARLYYRCQADLDEKKWELHFARIKISELKEQFAASSLSHGASQDKPRLTTSRSDIGLHTSQRSHTHSSTSSQPYSHPHNIQQQHDKQQQKQQQQKFYQRHHDPPTKLTNHPGSIPKHPGHVPHHGSESDSTSPDSGASFSPGLGTGGSRGDSLLHSHPAPTFPHPYNPPHPPKSKTLPRSLRLHPEDVPSGGSTTHAASDYTSDSERENKIVDKRRGQMSNGAEYERKRVAEGSAKSEGEDWVAWVKGRNKTEQYGIPALSHHQTQPTDGRRGTEERRDPLVETTTFVGDDSPGTPRSPIHFKTAAPPPCIASPRARHPSFETKLPLGHGFSLSQGDSLTHNPLSPSSPHVQSQRGRSSTHPRVHFSLSQDAYMSSPIYIRRPAFKESVVMTSENVVRNHAIVAEVQDPIDRADCQSPLPRVTPPPPHFDTHNTYSDSEQEPVLTQSQPQSAFRKPPPPPSSHGLYRQLSHPARLVLPIQYQIPDELTEVTPSHSPPNSTHPHFSSLTPRSHSQNTFHHHPPPPTSHPPSLPPTNTHSHPHNDLINDMHHHHDNPVEIGVVNHHQVGSVNSEMGVAPQSFPTGTNRTNQVRTYPSRESRMIFTKQKTTEEESEDDEEEGEEEMGYEGLNLNQLFDLVAKIIDPKCKITKLEITDSELGDTAAMQQLCEGLRQNTSLKELSLPNNNIRVESLEVLLQYIQHCTNIRELKLRGNNIGKECAPLIKALMEQTNLDSLVLTGNEIERHGDLLHRALPSDFTMEYDTAEGSVDSGVVVADNNDQYNNTSSSLKYLHV